MKKKTLGALIIIIEILAVSCVSGPQPRTESQTEPQTGTTQETVNTGTVQQEVTPEIIIDTFDPTRVSQAQYASTRSEVQQFIDNLNQIISNRNFTAWRAALSQEYIDEVSSPENLNRISEIPIMKSNNIVLRNLNDYFTRVVVPSRASSRISVDNVDIRFLSENRVRAYINRTNPAGEEVEEILYDLEKIDNSWKIIH